MLRGALTALIALMACAAHAASLNSLPGWAEEDHSAALAAIRSACAIDHDAALMRVCREAPTFDFYDDAAARAFLEDNFTATPLGEGGRLTAYFTPVYEARWAPEGEFTAPVRPAPAARAGRGRASVRTVIEARPARDALAWMRPEDLFFMQVQGSGVLAFADGARRAAIYAGDNGAPFVGVASPMRTRGLLGDSETSAEAIHDWLASHRGPEAEAIMDLDPRYVFFRLGSDDGVPPVGAAGVRLTPGRSVAVDPDRIGMGEILWLDGDAPTLAGAFPAYRRLAVALDTGGAIKGQVRADLYLGRGEAAGREAGRVRHALALWRLVPVR